MVATACTAAPAATLRATSSKRHAFTAAVQLRSGRQQWQPLRVAAVLTAEKSEMDVSKMSPLGDRLLVKPQEVESKTAGGILLAPTSSGGRGMHDALVGTVMAVGEDVDIGVAAGDRVLFSKYSSSDLEVPDGEVSFVAQKSILAKLS